MASTDLLTLFWILAFFGVVYYFAVLREAVAPPSKEAKRKPEHQRKTASEVATESTNRSPRRRRPLPVPVMVRAETEVTSTEKPVLGKAKKSRKKHPSELRTQEKPVNKLAVKSEKPKEFTGITYDFEQVAAKLGVETKVIHGAELKADVVELPVTSQRSGRNRWAIESESESSEAKPQKAKRQPAKTASTPATTKTHVQENTIHRQLGDDDVGGWTTVDKTRPEKKLATTVLTPEEELPPFSRVPLELLCQQALEAWNL